MGGQFGEMGVGVSRGFRGESPPPRVGVGVWLWGEKPAWSFLCVSPPSRGATPATKGHLGRGGGGEEAGSLT